MIRAGGKAGLAAAGVAAVVLAGAGCGSSSSKTSAPPTTASAPTSTTPAASSAASTPATSTTPATGAAAVGTKVTVIETEYHMAFSTLTFHPGTYTFVAVDTGKAPHAVTVQGPGVDASTATIEPGQTASVTVTLRAGSYDVYCPIPGHKALGMNQEITVGNGSSGVPPSTAPVSPTTMAPAAPTTSVPGGGGVSY
jgi:uncharacterized cupredoxin-like copper-binding protein